MLLLTGIFVLLAVAALNILAGAGVFCVMVGHHGLQADSLSTTTCTPEDARIGRNI
jgi:hypothetical protein